MAVRPEVVAPERVAGAAGGSGAVHIRLGLTVDIGHPGNRLGHPRGGQCRGPALGASCQGDGAVGLVPLLVVMPLLGAAVTLLLRRYPALQRTLSLGAGSGTVRRTWS